MNVASGIAIVCAAVGLGVGALLFVRRYAPAGSVFEDGDRAAGVFGVLATGFAILLGATPQQVTLAWMLALSQRVIPIPGSSRPDTARASAAAVDLVLTTDQLVRLSA